MRVTKAMLEIENTRLRDRDHFLEQELAIQQRLLTLHEQYTQGSRLWLPLALKKMTDQFTHLNDLMIKYLERKM